MFEVQELFNLEGRGLHAVGLVTDNAFYKLRSGNNIAIKRPDGSFKITKINTIIGCKTLDCPEEKRNIESLHFPQITAEEVPVGSVIYSLLDVCF